MVILYGILLLIGIIVGSILLYRKLRPCFSVEVNCWFCNKDTRVPHGNKNCWDCPYCEQYNGFTSDGDYNKSVPAQHMEEVNHPVTSEPGEFLTRGLFLCQRCQRNQLLKVKQLAAFEPLNEAAYDDEMARYQRHLESVYALCPSCESFVRRELQRLDDSLMQQQGHADIEKPPKEMETASQTLTYKMMRSVDVHKMGLLLVESVTVISSLLLLAGCFSRHWPHSAPWWTGEGTPALLPDDVATCLCGLVVCIASKLILGKERLCLEDAVHILLWLTALLVLMFHGDAVLFSVAPASVSLTVVLATLEVWLVLKQRHSVNATTPIMKRLSLDGSASFSSASSQAASEAVSSVSTSLRREPLHIASDPLNTDRGRRNPLAEQASFTASRSKAEERLAQGANGAFKTAFKAKKRGKTFSKSDDLDLLSQELSSAIGVCGSESGYSTGRSSPFTPNPFGSPAEPTLETGATFPRPLLSPPRLSYVPFSSSAVTGTKVFSPRPRPDAPTSLFSTGRSPDGAARGMHYNLFLAQESRPLSMFSSDDHETRSSISDIGYTKSNHFPTSSGLFSKLGEPKSVLHTKSFSEADFPLKAPSSWRSVRNRNVTPDREIASKMFPWKKNAGTTKDKFPNDKEENKDMGEDLPEYSIPECDSTTPDLFSLHISALCDGEKSDPFLRNNSKAVRGDPWEVSDEEGEDGEMENDSYHRPSALATASSWGGGPWLHTIALLTIVISITANIFLMWTVWSPWQRDS